MRKMKFRDDIQILRGIGVLYVVLFHLGFESIQSGFLGVDVFFVVSGFLMAVLYDHEDKKGFFLRRARRLLPAYYIVVVATLFASVAFNTLNEIVQVASQSKFAATFLSNVGFWSQNSYFSKDEFNPLLHLWSLGVEIQFYLLVPVIAWFFSKSRYFLYIFLICSFVLCCAVLTISPKTSFFMMPLRVWEFLFGYGVALYLTRDGDIKIEGFRWIGAIGLLLLVSIPFLNVDGESLNVINGHPGLIALSVVAATSIILAFGLPLKVENNIVARGLVVLGRYSYSIYLVHFPVIVIYLSRPFEGTVLDISSMTEMFILLVLISVLSITLYNLVERRRFDFSIFKFVVTSSSIVFFFAVSLPLLKGALITDDEKKVFNAFQDRSEYRCGKLVRIINPKALFCELTNVSSSQKPILLLGNSHADSIKTTFMKIASESKKKAFFVVANNPLMAGGLTPKDIINETVSNDINHIIVHFSPNGATPEKLAEFASLAGKKNVDVTFIDPVPVWGKHIPKMMYDQLKKGEKGLLQTKEDYLAFNEDFFNAIDKIKSDNFKRIKLVDYFCKPVCSYKNEQGEPLYFDNGHLTLTGSLVIAPVLERVLN